MSKVKFFFSRDKFSKIAQVFWKFENVKKVIHKVKKKMPSITNLATTTALTALENKIPNESKKLTITQSI